MYFVFRGEKIGLPRRLPRLQQSGPLPRCGATGRSASVVTRRALARVGIAIGEIASRIQQGNCVLFTGAGINKGSTNSRGDDAQNEQVPEPRTEKPEETVLQMDLFLLDARGSAQGTGHLRQRHDDDRGCECGREEELRSFIGFQTYRIR